MRAEGRAKAEATALQERRARQEAEEDAALDEDPLERGPDGDVAAGAARAEAAALAAELKPSQLHGIAAKRLALQRINPLKMLITSPRHGLDKVRIVPWTLARGVDSILKEQGFIAGLNAQTREKNYALWHVANRSAVEFAVLVRVFDEIVKRLPSLDPHSVLDYGSATGMTLAALQESLNKYANRDAERGGELCAPVKLYRSVESNAELARMATRLLEHVVAEEKITVQHRAHLAALPKAEPGAEAVLSAVEQSGVVVAPFSLGLLPDAPRRQKVLDNLWASVQPGGVLVLVEAGSIEGFSTVRLAREYLLDKHGMRSMAQRIRPGAADSAANVVAPCGSNGVCPMGDLSLKRSCWFRTEILTSSLPLRTPDKHLRTKDGTTVETFSYLVLHKGPVRVSPRDATLALAKWQAKEKDIHEPGQQSWRAVAEREAEEIRARLVEEEEARIRAEQGEPEPPQDATDAPAPEVDAAAAEFNASVAAGAEQQPAAEADADAESEPAPALDPAPVTKRTDLAPLAHLLPSETVPPQTMFEHTGYSRIMRKPLKRGEHVVLDLCNEHAQLERRIVAKSYGLPYVLARAVSEGDLWPLAKRVRLPTDPPGKGEKRRQEIAERKERRAARLAAMDTEEAAAAKAELKATHAAAKAALRAAKKQKRKEAADEAILARGGDVRIPMKRSEGPAWEMMEQMAKAEREAERELMAGATAGDADQNADAAAATAPAATAASAAGVPPPIPRAKQAPKPRVAAPRTPASADAAADAAATAAADPASPAVGTSAASPTAPKPAAKADKARGKIARSPSLMPDWMKTIMAQTRRAPGGLEYTGPVPVQARLTPEEEAMDRDEDGAPDDAGDYSFEPDPTIRATKLRRLGSLPADQLTLEEAAELKRARIAAERLSEREARAASPLAFKRQLATDFDEPAQSSQTADGSAASAASASASAAKESAAAANAAAAAALGIRLPKWAAYRKIKNPTAPVPRAPAEAETAARGSAASRFGSGGPRDASDRALAEHEERAWDSVMAEAARDGGDAARAASNAAARGSAGYSSIGGGGSGSSNFFKSEQVAAITSSLPPHLARLVDEASSSPEAKHLAALAAQSRNMRDENSRLASMRFHIRQHHKAKQAKAGGGGGSSAGAQSRPKSAKKGPKRY